MFDLRQGQVLAEVIPFSVKGGERWPGASEGATAAPAIGRAGDRQVRTATGNGPLEPIRATGGTV